MKRLAYLVPVLLLAFGCGSSGSNQQDNTKQEVSYEVEVTEGWGDENRLQEDSLRVRYSTGPKLGDDTVEVLPDPQFSTTESINLSLAEESALDDDDTTVCITAGVIGEEIFTLRMVVRGGGRSTAFEEGVGTQVEALEACLPDKVEE